MRLSHVKSHIDQQLALSELISHAYENLVRPGTQNVTSQRVHTRIVILKETWERFALEHKAITLAASALNNEDTINLQNNAYFKDNFYFNVHECYVESLEKMNCLLEQYQPISLARDSLISPTLELPSSSTRDSSNAPSQFPTSILTQNPPNFLTPELRSLPGASSSQPISLTSSNLPVLFHHARLPRIELPKFDGTPSDWLPFKDLFSSVVNDNPAFAPVAKLQLLKTHVIGSASMLLKNTMLSSANFESSWETLVSFYENKRLLVNSAIHSLVSLKRMTKESAVELEKLYTNVLQIYRTLESLQRPVASWDDFIVFIVTQRLDSDSVKVWEQQLGPSKEPPTWKQLSEFLVSRLRSQQAYERSRSNKYLAQPSQPPVKSHYQGASDNSKSIDTKSCSICSKNHFTVSCPQYVNKTVIQRIALIRKLKLCFNCLRKHIVAQCTTTKRCQKCAAKHHTTIHHKKGQDVNATKTKADETTASNSEGSENSKANVLHASFERYQSSNVLLATAIVKIRSPNGEVSEARALIDQGSEVSLITERLVQRLLLPREPSHIALIGIGAQKTNKTKGLTSFTLIPRFESTFQCLVTAHILPKLTSSLPSVAMEPQRWSHLDNLKLADPHYLTPKPIDLILGSDAYCQIIEERLIKGSLVSPIAQLTKLGWIISGPTTKHGNHPVNATYGYHVHINDDLYSILRKFWEMEETSPSHVSMQSADELACEEHFKNTHSRDEQGRYIIQLPFKQPIEKLGDSKTKAKRIVTRLFNTFQTNEKYSQTYSDFIKEYEDLNHMQLVSETQPEPPYACYLPHHGVLREQSLTTKLRVVFNGSSPTTTGYSLNDILHTGAKLQTDLFDILIWFRLFRFVFSSDMEKMYRQIRVHPDNWKFQRILWMDKNRRLCTYELTTVTYGLASSPYLALRVLLQLIDDEGSRFPLAIPTLRKGRYVDDVFGGGDSIDQAQEIVDQVNKMCMAGGFKLRKWISNHQAVLQAIPAVDQINSSIINITEDVIIHTLGLCWQPSSDIFQFTLHLSFSTVVTKRIILSTIAKIFDPLGLLSPLIITAKIMIQELWSIKLDWDDPLPDLIADKWIKFVNNLKEMPKLTFPRWIGYTSDSQIEIHGFCDASQRAMAAAVYMRVTNPHGNITSLLLASKTKVAPLKKMTIPRLELSGAYLLTKLVSHLLQVLELNNIPVYLWTDSSITYTWLNNHPSRWREFVQNRVCYIQEKLPQAHWRFVKGSENPADLATRGLTPMQLAPMTIWWNGPHWLSQPSEIWPNCRFSQPIQKNLEERINKVTTVTQSKTSWDLLYRYSDLSKLFRITALCRRAVFKFKINSKSDTGPLTVTELEQAKYFWVRTIQKLHYRQEVESLVKSRVLSKSSSLFRLTPFVDSAGLLRIGGRLQNSLLSFSEQHPLIIPKNSALTTLIIYEAHSRTLHGGTQSTLSYIRNIYWIVGGRAPVRAFILRCVKCARYRQKRAQQLMGQLPRTRVTPTRSFVNSGLDYAGPFVLKTWRGKNARTYKAYIALFICMSTSAIHLELVTDYTTDAFIAAFKRFTARRGICSTLTSDCGTNFKGADAELKKMFTSSTNESDRLAALLAKDGTQWHFNPPSAPHFGGKWEAGVKSVKHHLHRIIGNTYFTYEEFNTLLIQIESVLNSRPLTPLTEDAEDLSALTPGHFLMGCAPAVIPEPSLQHVNTTHLSRWQLIRQRLESFWTRWSKECLQRYLAIYKWNKEAPSISIGTLVLVVDERYPPSKWPLGRVTQTHPGKDGLIRVVTIRTQTSTLKRPIAKICPLPISQDSL